MVNLLGLGSENGDSLDERLTKLRSIEACHLHWYGKDEIPGRKVGHVTTLLSGTTAMERDKHAKQMLETIRKIWPLPLNW